MDDAQQPPPRWQPIGPVERRVLGVLVEKAKTTPDAYPMTLNGIVTGSNQKSNRHPMMQLEPEDVEEALERLRGLGAVAIVQGVGRVSKYRHYFYEWLGVEKVEAAVMAELLLRGAQTEGELRGHASRMEPIADLAALRPVVVSLKEKGLVIPLTPEGRGHVLAHALFSPRELENLKAQHGGAGSESAPLASATRTAPPAAVTTAASTAAQSDEIDVLRRTIDELRAQVTQLRGEMADLAAAFAKVEDQLQRLRADLGA